MPVTDASQQALLKSSLKDTFCLSILRNQVSGLCQSICGAQFWILWRKEVEIIANLCYYILTTIRGSQTLGEEYVCIIQVDSSKKNIPSKLQRVFLVLLQCLSPYLIEKICKHLETKVGQLSGFSDNRKRRIQILIHHFLEIIPVVEKFHLMCFYMYGVYESIAKRVAGIKHILIRPYNKAEFDLITFRWLAALGGIQLIAKSIMIMKELQKELDVPVEILSENTMPSRSTESRVSSKCILCLDYIKDVSTTPCGHLFCWKCIVEWCSVKPECPACREECSPSRIICLHYYIME